MHFYLPPKESINKDYLKQILVNEKILLTMDEVRFIKVPKYEELSVKALYPEAIADEKLRKYLPDQTERSKPLDR